MCSNTTNKNKAIYKNITVCISMYILFLPRCTILCMFIVHTFFNKIITTCILLTPVQQKCSTYVYLLLECIISQVVITPAGLNIHVIVKCNLYATRDVRFVIYVTSVCVHVTYVNIQHTINSNIFVYMLECIKHALLKCSYVITGITLTEHYTTYIIFVTRDLFAYVVLYYNLYQERCYVDKRIGSYSTPVVRL